MADEPAVPAAEAPQVDAGLQALQDRATRAEGKIVEYEKLLLDPVFLQYLSAKQSGTLPVDGQPKAPQKVADFDAMSNTEIVDYVLRTMSGMLAQAVVPVQQQTQFDHLKADVEKAAAKYPDFWDYQDEMIRIGKTHTTLSAEEAYHLAKSRPGSRKVKSSEIPGGGGSTKAPIPKGFAAAFSQAFKESGLKNRGEE